MTGDEPLMPPSQDGIYPRCVWCRGENWAPAVLAYSVGEVPCVARPSCGRFLPDDYITEGDQGAPPADA